jgi:pilus assembly protein Flp/PilA
MDSLKKRLAQFSKEDSGQDLIEYALVAGMIGLGAVASMTALATAIKTAFTNIGTSLTTNV